MICVNDNLDYKEAYLTMMRASEQALRKLELMQKEMAQAAGELIQAQQKAEELLLEQGEK